MHSCIWSRSEEGSGQNPKHFPENFCCLSEVGTLIKPRGSQRIVLLIFVECESAVRSCGDGVAVYQSQRWTTVNRPTKVAAPSCLLGTQGAASGAPSPGWDFGIKVHRQSGERLLEGHQEDKAKIRGCNALSFMRSWRNWVPSWKRLRGAAAGFQSQPEWRL